MIRQPGLEYYIAFICVPGVIVVCVVPDADLNFTEIIVQPDACGVNNLTLKVLKRRRKITWRILAEIEKQIIPHIAGRTIYRRGQAGIRRVAGSARAHFLHFLLREKRGRGETIHFIARPQALIDTEHNRHNNKHQQHNDDSKLDYREAALAAEFVFFFRQLFLPARRHHFTCRNTIRPVVLIIETFH